MTFTSPPWGLYEWTVMPQGGCNALATHQCQMTDALRELIGKICHVYLHNIIIWSQTMEEHEQNCTAILEALQKASIYCNQAKSNLFATELCFLGHIISGAGIKPDP
jgi:Reverse transcriptase (RNA-dependent DNA polymerase)